MTHVTRRAEETALIIRGVRLTRALMGEFGIDPPDELVARIIHAADDIRPLGPQKWSYTAPPEWEISQAVAALPHPTTTALIASTTSTDSPEECRWNNPFVCMSRPTAR